MQLSSTERNSIMIILVSAVVLAAFLTGFAAGLLQMHGDTRFIAVLVIIIPLLVYLLYKKIMMPSYRRLEDSNLELHLKQEELLDVKDDLFIKFLGVYDVNYAANSPRLFVERLHDVADITARVMEADACFIYLYDRKRDDLLLSASNDASGGVKGNISIPLGEGIEGWVGRRLEPLMLKDFRTDTRYKIIPGLVVKDYVSLYCVPLYVYSNGALVGVMEVLYKKSKTFSDEEINFFTTLSGILSTTIQNEQMQTELRKMNIELEQWVAEKTEELRSSEERYRTLVDNAGEAIFLLAENGDIVFSNEQAVRLSGYSKYDLVHRNFFDFFTPAEQYREILPDSVAEKGSRSFRMTAFHRSDGSSAPVSVSAVDLVLMGKRFVQTVVRDDSRIVGLESQLAQRERELSSIKEKNRGN